MLHLSADLTLRLDSPSGDARVFTARGKRLCCRPCQSDQFCNQGIFQDFGHRGCEPTFGVPSSSLPSCSLPIPLLAPPILHPFPSSPLKVDPLNPAKRSRERCKLPAGFGVEPRPKSNLVHFSLKISHPFATNLMFPENQMTKFHA